MIVVGLPERSKTKKVCCPVCKSRLCDAVIGSDDNKITVQNGYDTHFIVKCGKCKQQIGIAIVLNRV